MKWNDPFFLGLCIATCIGFVLKAISSSNPDRSNISESPMTKMVAQTIFLVLVTILWLIILFR